ncbi:MAG: hypothetical protein KF824_08730 [Fimbriimonadaceae bacterium]|nr:MAG: hypothetical protein KF824_08730 [Fimbriimonadaceae bacterium]
MSFVPDDKEEPQVTDRFLARMRKFGTVEIELGAANNYNLPIIFGSVLATFFAVFILSPLSSAIVPLFGFVSVLITFLMMQNSRIKCRVISEDRDETTFERATLSGKSAKALPGATNNQKITHYQIDRNNYRPRVLLDNEALLLLQFTHEEAGNFASQPVIKGNVWVAKNIDDPQIQELLKLYLLDLSASLYTQNVSQKS